MEDKTKKVYLVTGGSGLVGQGLKMALDVERSSLDFEVKQKLISSESWYFTNSYEADLLDEMQVRELFLKYSPTHVIHLAANVGGLYKNMQDNLNMYRKNCKINDNVLSACHDFKVKKCVSCLSTCIFPDKIERYPITEEMLHGGPPHDSNFGYSYAKRNLEILSRCYNMSGGCLFTNIVPCNVFGFADNFDLVYGHVVPSLVHKAHLAKQQNEPFVVFGSGQPLRQFIYNLDLGRLLLLLVREYNSAESVIVADDADKEVSIRQLAEMVRDATDEIYNDGFKGHKLQMVFDENQPDGQFRKTVSNARMRKMYPNFKFTPLKQAVYSTVLWFKENHANARM